MKSAGAVLPLSEVAFFHYESGMFKNLEGL
jgi:hypothetical protein